ncbi:ATP-grasp domain-containing protein [Nonomuraea sp. SYSU D8015]|uniref:ATP-grasp domain-containing protein n=1 Tax=Nonomuraea sp. SYSU D8015 TaxID=2593644 RepID=UPI001661806C|nr:hypothetical protein [Nonomuraea sp. SYSU D8015]
MTSALPTALVAYGLGSASPAEIVDAADGLCEVVFVADSRDEHTRLVLPFMEEVADVLDLAELSGDVVADRVDGRVHGVVTFSEFMLTASTELAARLGLPFHTPETTGALTDKVEQRALLNSKGVTSLRQVAVDTPEGFAQAVREIGFPAVIKPACGTASVDVYLCTSWADLAAISPSPRSGGWVVEEMLVPGRHPATPWLGDYCSVESAVSHGRCWHFAIIERLPLTPPLRESGFLAPDTLPAAFRSQVLELAEAAIHAVGITTGITHVEIKFTPDGPQVIEVNGRMGGTTGRLLRRASDLDPFRLALEIALDRDIAPRDVAFDRSVIAFRVLPPPRQVTVREARTPADFRALAGVWAVDGGVRRGQVLDWRRGGLEKIFTIWAEADDPAALSKVIQDLQSAAADCVTYDG